MSNFRYSIIIPLYNRALLIDKTVDSVVFQSCPNWELIIVDDDSTDGSFELVQQWQNNYPDKIRVFRRNRYPKGASTCRNIGLEMSKGDFIIFLDSDDLLAKDALDQRLKFFEQDPKLEMLITPCTIFKESANDTNRLWNRSESIFQDLDRFLILDIPWQTTSVTWRKESITRLGGWNEELLSWQDWELGIRAIIKQVVYKKLGKPDCFWRMPSENRTSIGSSSVSLPHLESHFRLFSKLVTDLEDHKLLIEERKEKLLFIFYWLYEKHRISNRWAAFKNFHYLISLISLNNTLKRKFRIVTLLTIFGKTHFLKQKAIKLLHLEKIINQPEPVYLHRVHLNSEAE
jgi:glycosyltransferase involved in cell wall biosynthesis